MVIKYDSVPSKFQNITWQRDQKSKVYFQNQFVRRGLMRSGCKSGRSDGTSGFSRNGRHLRSGKSMRVRWRHHPLHWDFDPLGGKSFWLAYGLAYRAACWFRTLVFLQFKKFIVGAIAVSTNPGLHKGWMVSWVHLVSHLAGHVYDKGMVIPRIKVNCLHWSLLHWFNPSVYCVQVYCTHWVSPLERARSRLPVRSKFGGPEVELSIAPAKHQVSVGWHLVWHACVKGVHG